MNTISSIPYTMINEVIGCRSNVLTPAVGMCGTYFVGSDRYGGVVVKVNSPKEIVFVHFGTDDVLKRKFTKDGVEYVSMDDVNRLYAQEFPDRYEDDPEMRQWYIDDFYRRNTFTLRKNGRWVCKGEPLNASGAVHLGVADTYLDPCF